MSSCAPNIGSRSLALGCVGLPPNSAGMKRFTPASTAAVIINFCTPVPDEVIAEITASCPLKACTSSCKG